MTADSTGQFWQFCPYFFWNSNKSPAASHEICCCYCFLCFQLVIFLTLLLLIIPQCHSQLQILIGGFLETLSLCYITIVGLAVLPVDPSVIVLLMCSLAVVPSIWQATSSRSRFHTTSGKLHAFKFSASAVIAVLGIALLTWKVMAKPVIRVVFTWIVGSNLYLPWFCIQLLR